MTIEPGDQAPAFTLPASGGRTVSLAGQHGKPFVLYFYPKADTPGCTTQACGLRDIASDEEITVDYDKTETGGVKVPCTCKAQNCRSTFMRVE